GQPIRAALLRHGVENGLSVRPVRRLPRWLSLRRVALLASIFVVGGAGIASYATYLRNRVLLSNEDALSVAGTATADRVRDWQSSRRSEVARLAQFIAVRSQ